MKRFDPSRFTTTKAKPLPVYLLLDVSKSMEGEKIKALNLAVREMLETFAKNTASGSQIVVSIITFGGVARMLLRPTPASQVRWTDMGVDGNTPMGAAIAVAKNLIEDRDATPSRGYRPTVILVSDDEPNDEWEGPLDNFVGQGRSSKCDRMAMAIGVDAARATKALERFIAGTPHQLFVAGDASRIHEFFKGVTMSVTARTHSVDPNRIPAVSESKQDAAPDKQRASEAPPSVPLDSSSGSVSSEAKSKRKSTKKGPGPSAADAEDGYW